MQETTHKSAIFAAKIAVFAGLVFVICQLFEFFSSDLSSIHDSLNKVTIQSNLFAFLIASAYVYNPYSKIFKCNILIICVGALLLMAAIGFWFILFPVYFINLEQYLVNVDSFGKKNTGFVVFSSIWTHAITQICYTNFLKKVFLTSDKHHLFPARLSDCIKLTTCYLGLVFVMYIIYSWLDVAHPAYGIFSNFNWNSQFKTEGGAEKFNLKIALFSIVLMSSISMGLVFLLQKESVKLNEITRNQQSLN